MPPDHNCQMARKSKTTTTIAIIFLCVAVIFVAKWGIEKARDYSTRDVAARAKGFKDAPLKITEYIDFQCPACAQGSVFLSRYIEEYPRRIYLQVKYFPLGQAHKHAYRSALYAECSARQGKFWPFHDQIMATQPEWSGLINADPVFDGIARDVGLDKQELNACLANESIMDMIFSEKDQGRSLGVSSTPTYIINGEVFVGTRSLQEKLRTSFSGEEN